MPVILNKYLPATKLFFVAGEALCIVFSLLLASLIRLGWQELFSAISNGDFWLRMLLMSSTCQIALYYNDLYDLRVTDTYLELGLRLIQALGISAIFLAVLYYVFPLASLGRGIFVIGIFFLILLVSSWRYLYSWTLKKRMFTESIIVIGTDKIAQDIVDEITSRQDSGYKIAAMFDCSNVELNPCLKDQRFISGYEQICQYAKEHSVQKIIVALNEKRHKMPLDELLSSKMAGIEVVDGISFYEMLTGRILIESLSPSWLIFSRGFKKSRGSRIVKRTVGIVLSLLGFIATLPLCLFAAILIKLDSSGPVFYSQMRCGEGGTPFRLYKLRSMIADAEDEGGAIWAQEDDPRITRVGHIIRKLRIDEIPQLWNVLKGDMSFVGPRPERPEFIKELARSIPFYEQRMNVKPGITGWAQVCHHYGASVEDAKEKLQYELFYIKNMNMLFDLTIMLQTIKIVLLGRGAR